MSAKSARSVMRAAAKAEQECIDARWHDAEVQEALSIAEVAIEEFYNGNREWAESWLLKAFAANQGNNR